MFMETSQFLGENGQVLAAATWTMPDGEVVLVCRTPDGFALYTHAEWSNSTVPSYRADSEGRVRLHDRMVAPQDPAWVLPQKVQDQALR
jgi:hypothetical protein